MLRSEHQPWRTRLLEAIRRTGKKHSAIAREAGINPETMSRILTGNHPRISFDVVVRVTHATGRTVGWLLQERGYCLSGEDRARLRNAAATIIQVTT